MSGLDSAVIESLSNFEGNDLITGDEGMLPNIGRLMPACSCSATVTVSSMCSRTNAEEMPVNKPAIKPKARYRGGLGRVGFDGGRAGSATLMLVARRAAWML